MAVGGNEKMNRVDQRRGETPFIAQQNYTKIPCSVQFLFLLSLVYSKKIVLLHKTNKIEQTFGRQSSSFGSFEPLYDCRKSPLFF